MHETDIRVVRGVNIAAIVLSALAILCCVAAIALSIGLGALASDPSNFEGYVAHRGDLGATHGLDAQFDMSADDTSLLVSAVFGFLGVLSGIGLVLCAVSLVAGIIGIRDCRNTQKAGKIFGWSIAGAICALLMGRVISCALLVISAVYAHRLTKKASATAYAQSACGFAPQGYAPQGYAQPAAQQPFANVPVQQPAPQQPMAAGTQMPQPATVGAPMPQPATAPQPTAREQTATSLQPISPEQPTAAERPATPPQAAAPEQPATPLQTAAPEQPETSPTPATPEQSVDLQ